MCFAHCLARKLYAVAFFLHESSHCPILNLPSTLLILFVQPSAKKLSTVIQRTYQDIYLPTVKQEGKKPATMIPLCLKAYLYHPRLPDNHHAIMFTAYPHFIFKLYFLYPALPRVVATLNAKCPANVCWLFGFLCL